jgi:hypothetical protein
MTGVELLEAHSDEVAEMSDGFPGAINVLCAICLYCPGVAVDVLISLRAMGVRGARIYGTFKQLCNEDLDNFCERALRRDPALYE